MYAANTQMWAVPGVKREDQKVTCFTEKAHWPFYKTKALLSYIPSLPLASLLTSFLIPFILM